MGIERVQRIVERGVPGVSAAKVDEQLVTIKVPGVGLDDWKLPIFKKHLDAAGYKYESSANFTEGTLILRVHYESVHAVQPIFEAAQRECARTAVRA